MQYKYLYVIYIINLLIFFIINQYLLNYCSLRFFISSVCLSLSPPEGTPPDRFGANRLLSAAGSVSQSSPLCGRFLARKFSTEEGYHLTGSGINSSQAPGGP